MFDYNGLGRELSPFLLLDYAAPYEFPPGNEKRGVGGHPHKGFETVTVAYQGELEHRDSSGGGGTVQVIAGDYGGRNGPAKTCTPINLWDVKLRAGKSAELPLPNDHTTTFLVMSGEVEVDGKKAGEGDLPIFDRAGTGITVKAKTDTKLLVMDDEPFTEPVMGHGPFVMNRRAKIQQALEDYQMGKMGQIA